MLSKLERESKEWPVDGVHYSNGACTIEKADRPEGGLSNLSVWSLRVNTNLMAQIFIMCNIIHNAGE